MNKILTKKKIYTNEDTIQLEVSCNTIIQSTLPQKANDLRRVTLIVTISNVSMGKVLIDLVASINLIPLLIIRKIGDLELKQTRMTLQLRYKSIKSPLGIIKDMLVKVKKIPISSQFCGYGY